MACGQEIRVCTLKVEMETVATTTAPTRYKIYSCAYGRGEHLLQLCNPIPCNRLGVIYLYCLGHWELFTGLGSESKRSDDQNVGRELKETIIIIEYHRAVLQRP